jgi:broad specificity phosphatase PhoE
MRQRLALSLAILLALAAVPGSASGPTEPPTGPELAFLVRHAEKDPGDDPGLSAAGSARALRLAELLAGQSIERVYVTATRRARDTAAPLAARFGLPVEIYDPKKLAELATTLRERKETVLVVGHSNTTDELAVLLGGESAGPMPDEEYDRLYRVDLTDGSTVVRRY